MNCKVCDRKLEQSNYNKKQWNYKVNSHKKGGNVYCSRDCSLVISRQVSSETMAKTNRKYASERMKINNPTFNPLVREKISKANKGRVPSKRMGNGTGMTIPQKHLFDALKKHNPIAEFPIKTNQPRGSDYPQCYKADIAIPEINLAIEVDGLSHSAHCRKEEDIRRDSLLESLGWYTIRFKNSKINDNLPACVEEVEQYICKILENTK